MANDTNDCEEEADACMRTEQYFTALHCPHDLRPSFLPDLHTGYWGGGGPSFEQNTHTLKFQTANSSNSP